jgi:uncharacterized membrane protein
MYPLFVLQDYPQLGTLVFSPLALISFGVFSVLMGLLGVYIGFFADRKWVYLYEDYLEIQGPLSMLAERRLGLLPGRRTILCREIESLGKREPEDQGYLIIGTRYGPGWGRLSICCSDFENYQDLKAELLKRVPPACERYTLKPLGRRGPW